MMMRNLGTLLYIQLINLNIFPLRRFGRNIDRIEAERLGRWSTRLHFILLIIGLSVLAIYSIVEPRTLTKTFDKPNFNFYNYLIEKYGNELKCSCSLIASIYNDFVNIKPILHQICSSQFISKQWQMNITSGLTSNLSSYSYKDYRRHLSAHFQFLNGSCELSNQIVSSSINQFLSSLFISSQLLTKIDFHKRLDFLIEQIKSNTPITFRRLLFLIRNINHGNAIISSYGTNFQYISPWYELIRSYAPTEPMIYDNDCSCGLYSNCTSQASFIERNSSKILLIKGMKIGCIPSESFLASTLECFYDSLCINLIQQYIDSTNNIIPLSTTNISRFLINMTIDELINDLFIEQWSITLNYSSYFNQCLPLFCSYTYIQRYNLYYTITVLLGLQGGLTIVLKWICPKIIRIVKKIYQHRKKRVNIVQPINSLEIIPIESVNTNTIIHHPNIDVKPIPIIAISQTNPSSLFQCSYKIIIICILLIFVIITLVIFSIYVARQVSSKSTTTILINRNTTTSTDLTTRTICNLTFESISINSTNPRGYQSSPVVADFDNDKQLDLAFISENDSYKFDINVLLGNGNGTFKTALIFSIENIRLLNSIIHGDFNNDKQLDLIFISQSEHQVGVIFGNGNGTFRGLTTFSTEIDSGPVDIAVSDFNNDSYLDVAVVYQIKNCVDVFLGYGNGSFFLQTTLSTGPNSSPISITVGNFNIDGYLDIVVCNSNTINTIVYLGDSNLTFQIQKSFYIGSDSSASDIAVGDFNGDFLSDIVFSNSWLNNVGVLFGHSNTIFDIRKKFFIEISKTAASIAVSDFNCDGHPDIAVGQGRPYRIGILIGDGNGNFDFQTIFFTELDSFDIQINVGDFNGDGCQDIAALNKYSDSVNILLNTCECCTRNIVETSTPPPSLI